MMNKKAAGGLMGAFATALSAMSQPKPRMSGFEKRITKAGELSARKANKRHAHRKAVRKQKAKARRMGK